MLRSQQQKQQQSTKDHRASMVSRHMEPNNNISQQDASSIDQMAELPPMNASGQSSLSSNSSSSALSSTSTMASSGAGTTEAKLLSSNADYDNIRNTTLLFFLDRLYLASKEGKEARTLHDLSCLFGTKEFTKEMRQIVGASRNGLKRFLQSYPSLFIVEGDKVYLTQLKQESTIPIRDYNKEAADYFKQKLLQFGNSLVPIKNLFGYRSQASQEVRHVSGKNIRDFKQFLDAHGEVFEILADEHVVLKSALSELESLGQLTAEIETNLAASDENTMDPYLNKQFAHIIEQCVKKMLLNHDHDDHDENNRHQQSQATENNNNNDYDDNNKITLECLHERIKSDCANELFLKMVKTIEDLKVFLRMHPKLFKRFKCDQDGRDYVSLVTDEERKELQFQVSLPPSFNNIDRQHSNALKTPDSQQLTNNDKQQRAATSIQQPIDLFQLATSAPSQTAEAPMATGSCCTKQQRLASFDEASPRGELGKKSQSQQQAAASSQGQQLVTGRSKVDAGSSPATIEANYQQQKQAPRSSKLGFSQQQHHHQASSGLRANAPPFVPSKLPPNHHHQQQHNRSGVEPMATRLRQNSHSSSATLRSSSSSAHQQGHTLPITGSLSNLNQPRLRTGSGANRPQHQQQPTNGPVDQRKAIRNYLMRANSGGDTSSTNIYWSSSSSIAAAEAAASKQQTISTINGHQQQQQQPLPSPSSGDYLRARTIDIVREASNIISRIMNTTDAVAFDCKGYNLGLDGQITLIQFGFIPSKLSTSLIDELDHSYHQRLGSEDLSETTSKAQDGKQVLPKPEVCVFDLITNPELAYCLKPLLESESIVKVVHDVRNKSNALFVQFNIVLKNVFDTQVANLVLQQQVTGKPAYKSRYISMSKLCEIYGNEELMKYRNLIKSKTRHNNGSISTTSNSSSSSNKPSSASRIKDANYWRTRPLTKAMIYESTIEAYCLVGGIYQTLKAKIKPEYRPLFDQLNVENVLARIRPDEIRSAKKERKIDLEVIDLKKKLYSDTKGSIVLSNRELRLLRHIDLTEEVRSKIQQCKKVAKKIERLDMKAAQQQLQLQSLNSQLSSDEQERQQQQQQQLQQQQQHQQQRQQQQQQQHPTSSQLSLTSSVVSNGIDNAADLQQKDDDEDATNQFMMSNLMDGSMFDELKDKMIESSILLESLDDDDDVDDNGENTRSLCYQPMSTTIHSHGRNSHDCCRCQCHDRSVSELKESSISLDSRESSSLDPVYPTKNGNRRVETIASKDQKDFKYPESAQQVVKQVDENHKDDGANQSNGQLANDGADACDSSDTEKSAVVDMAIQCDLLS